MALLRIIGLQKRAANGIIIMQVLYFTIPGIIVGLLLSIGLYVILAVILNRLLLLNLPLTLPTNAYVLSIVVGFLSPLIAIASPVHSLAKQKLVESLDYQHSVFLLIISLSRMLMTQGFKSMTIERHPSQLK